MSKLKIKTADAEIINADVKPGESLLEAIQRAGVDIESPCGAMGICGKCRVRVTGGSPGRLTETESNIIPSKQLEDNVRLACQVYPVDDLAVEILKKPGMPAFTSFTGLYDDDEKNDGETVAEAGEEAYPEEKSILEKASIVAGKGSVDPDLKKKTVIFDKSGVPYEDQLLTSADADSADPFVFTGISVKPWKTYTALIRKIADGTREVISLEPGDTTDTLYGASVDIGTTTVVVSIIDMLTSTRVAETSMINPQKKHGQDVLTRITAEIRDPEEMTSELSEELSTAINALMNDACGKAGIDVNMIYEITIAGNTAMMHFLTGTDAASLGTAPFTPAFLDGRAVPADTLGLDAAPGAYAVLLPCVSSFIGADITAGAYVCGLDRTFSNTLFIDIGTNGEIVLTNEDDMIACSCAAGPALEGMNISCGVRAQSGAIEDVRISDGNVEIKTINDDEPCGICGSGILAAIRELRNSGLVDTSGSFAVTESSPYYDRFEKDEKDVLRFVLCREPEEISISQIDVRQVQLEKAAIYSGITALLRTAGMTVDETDKFIVAGQFGWHITEDELLITGILPAGAKGKIDFAGNTSLAGAEKALLSTVSRRSMERLTRKIRYIELGDTEGFEELFNSSLDFPEL
ncbi:MAG: ASKHA domain-containing protein [Anaerovoracaceae bacterium]